MRKLTLFCLLAAVVFWVPESVEAQKKRVVVKRPVRTRVVRVKPTRIVVHPKHPLRRTLPSTVVVRSARKTVVVNRPLVYLPSLAWRTAVVTLPNRDRLVWEDSETIEASEGWVDTNFGIDAHGNALFLQVDGAAQLSFAEITFGNGNVQVVDFNDHATKAGLYNVLDFADGREVKTMRLLAKSNTDETKLVVYLAK